MDATAREDLSTRGIAPIRVVGWLIAGALQPASYSPMGQTISVLAGYSGADRWVMTAALLLVGSCQIATGAGLTTVRLPARILLILTGLSTVGSGDLGMVERLTSAAQVTIVGWMLSRRFTRRSQSRPNTGRTSGTNP